MFAGWGSWVARFRWPVLSVALVAVISAGVWGLGVFGQLTEGGYNDPNSESSRATAAVQKAFGAQGGDLIVVWTPAKGTVDDVRLGKLIRAKLAALPKPAVKSSTSYWSTRAPQFVAKDKKSAVAVVSLTGSDDGAKLDSYRDIKDKFTVPGTKVEIAGGMVLADATSSRSAKDLGRAEIISLPIVLILLLLLFGSLVAASLPVLVGGAAVLGSLGILHAVAGVHEVNSFAVNVASLLGLGMAIDYGLFMVGRFREEQDGGRTPAEAVRRTVATAGRTVVFSATLLMTALAGLLLFPQGFLKSLAYGGLAAVGLAAALSLTLLPALLAVLGKRVDKLPIRLPGRGQDSSLWGRIAGAVLRRPVVVVLPILAGLLLLAAPIAGVRFGEADERTLPAGDPARQAIETLKSDYPQFSGNGMPIVLRGGQDSAAFAVTLRQIPGIAQIGPAQKAGDVTAFTATLKSSDPFSTEARTTVDQIRSLPVPKGAELLVGGTTARNMDSLAATAAQLPWMVGLLVGATLLLMFFAFGSILLPIKAVLMSALSLSATFGILVWIFQDGHGASWLNVTPAPLEAGIVVLMAAVVFGLSTDYEVFLLSRMVEARAHGASTNEAVKVGLARTGRVISAAAVLLIVVTGAFALSSVTTMRFVGVGMIVALLLDATVVRMLLVPAVLGLLGDAAWWAPGPLKRLHERAGLAEHAGEDTPALPTGRHAAADETALLALPPGPAKPTRAVWDREAAGILVLPPAMVPQALPAGRDAATTVVPKIVAEPAGDDIVDAEIIENDEDVAAEVVAGEAEKADVAEDEHVEEEIVADEPVADDKPAGAEPDGDEPAADEPVAAAADAPVGEAAEGEQADGDEPLAEVVVDEPAADAPSAERIAAAGPESITLEDSSTDAEVSDDAEREEPDSAAGQGSPYLPVPYVPGPGVYRSESVTTFTDYSAPDDFFFAASSAGTFADSLGLPAAPETTVPYFGERPDFESTGKIADLGLDATRSLEAPDLDATSTLQRPDFDAPPISEPPQASEAPLVSEAPPIFEAPNREVARTFESPDLESSQSIVLPDLAPPAVTPAPPAVTPAPAAVTPAPAAEELAPKPEPGVEELEPALDVTRSLEAPDLDVTRRLQVPGLETTRRMPAPMLERARLTNTPATAPDAAPTPTPAKSVTPPAVPLPQRPVPLVPAREEQPPVPEPSVAAAEGTAAEGTRPSNLGALFSPRRPAGPGENDLARRPEPIDEPAHQPGEFTEPTPLRRPATLGDQPYSFRPGQDAAEPPSPAYASAVAPPAQRRPADLGDHLRESRPADLAQYSRAHRATSERSRRTSQTPASSSADVDRSAEKPAESKPSRRPATLADQVPKQRSKPKDDQPGQ